MNLLGLIETGSLVVLNLYFLLQLLKPAHLILKKLRFFTISFFFNAQCFKMVIYFIFIIKKTLEAECRSCNVLIIWTDCDREGENIGFEIIDTCLKVKPNLDVYR